MPEKVQNANTLSRRERRDLDIEICFLEGLVRRDPGYVAALELLGDDYIRRGDVAEVIQIDQRLARLCPGDPRILYNLACGYSILRRIPEAVLALNRAIEAGYADFPWLAQDPDLENVRQHALYGTVRARIRAARAKIGPAHQAPSSALDG